AFVSDPDVVVSIYFHHVGEGPSVELMADLPQEIAVGIKFEKLRRGCGVGGTGGVATRKNEDVAIGIGRDAGNFTQMEIVRQLERVGHRVESNNWRLLLREGWCA